LVNPISRDEWLNQVAKWKAEHPFKYEFSEEKLKPQFVIEKIYEITKGEAIIVTDVGQHQMWAAQFYKHTHPRCFISSGGLGTMGYGLPAAIGAQLGCRDKSVVCISGDGSVQMNFQELVVAVEHKAPIKVVIINNGYLGMVRQWQELFYRKRYSATILGQDNRPLNERVIASAEKKYLPDFVKLAEAHGALGLRVEKPKDLMPLLEKAFSYNGPVVIECVVDSEENVLPMVPAGASLIEMIHSMA